MPDHQRLRQWLDRAWYGATAPWWLVPFAWLYALVVVARQAAYRYGVLSVGYPGVPVIVIGNITVGGTGKTPLVVWLATRLQGQGVRVGIALRGYGGSVHMPAMVAPESDPQVFGDEAVLLANRAGCPVMVGARRVDVARALAAAGCELIICDDGLQHLALRRDLTIAVIDGMRGFGNGALLPAGPLREPVSALKKIDFVVVNGTVAPDFPAHSETPICMAMRPGGLAAVAGSVRRQIQELNGCTVHAVAGIGNPRRFFDLLRDHGLRPVEHVFADHHAYVATDLNFDDDYQIVMTEKDAVKCRDFATGRMWYLPVSAFLADADAARLLAAARACLSRGDRRSA